MKTWILLSMGCIIVLMGNGCEFLGGTTGGSETTNGLTGIIHDTEGKPVAQAAVVLLPETYNPIPGQDTRPLKRTSTDKTGAYRFDGVAAGVYNLEAKDAQRHVQLLMQGIQIDSGASAAQADGILEVPGTLEIPFADRHLPENAQAYVPGTTYTTFVASKLNAQGTLVLENLAPGLYRDMLAISSDLPGGGPVSIASRFRIGADSVTTLAPLQAWLHASRLKLDATGIAGGSADALTGYPLMVHLSPANFDFSQARSGGEDIRFTRTDGTPLPHQIEQWDPIGKSALVWVRLDSLPLASVDSSVVMHWGRVDAMDVSRGDLVFDTAQGFSSVWHLGEPVNSDSGGFKDATSGARHATAIAPNLETQAGVVAGWGRKFSSAGGQLSAPLAPELGGNASFSVTFWMNFSMTPARAAILTFGQPTLEKGFHFLIRPDTSAQFGPWDTSPDSIDSPSAQQNHFSLVPYLGQWAYVATVYDAVKGTLSTYVNGELQAANTLTGMDIQAAFGVNFGKHIDPSAVLQSDYAGALDEVRIYNRPITESWIRMEYQSQKENSAILSIP